MFINLGLIFRIMPIISLSINEKLASDLDFLQDSLGYSGRSEIIRAAIREFMTEKEKDKLLEQDKSYYGSIILILAEQSKDSMHAIQHHYGHLIKTQIHQCVSDCRCMNVFIVEGKGRELKSLVRRLEKIPRAESVRLVLAV